MVFFFYTNGEFREKNLQNVSERTQIKFPQLFKFQFYIY